MVIWCSAGAEVLPEASVTRTRAVKGPVAGTEVDSEEVVPVSRSKPGLPSTSQE